MGFGDFIKEPDPESYYVPPPQLPGVVRSDMSIKRGNGRSIFSQYLIIAIIAICFISGIVQGVIEQDYIKLFVFFFFIIVICYIFLFKSKEVYLTSEAVTVRYGFRKNKHRTESISDYFLLVNKANQAVGYVGKHYAYSVYLVPKKIIYTEINDGIVLSEDLFKKKAFSAKFALLRGWKNIEKHGGILFHHSICAPDNLKQYVEAIQSQVSVSLPVVFSSEQIKRDYTTGKYRS